jgi:glycosyltransferase involved in cell wall biosynthesis
MEKQHLASLSNAPAVHVSIVVPVLNEQNVLERLVKNVLVVFELEYPQRMELIIVDDGSSDNSLFTLQQLQQQHSSLKVLSLEESEGQSAAIWVGLQHARGKILATMDGDGQYDPDDLLKVVKRVDLGCEFAIGYRHHRSDRLAKRVFSSLANGFRRWLTGSTIPDSGCSLRAFERKLLVDLIPFKGLHRFLPTLFESANRSIAIVRVSHFPRCFGSSHYGFVFRGALGVADCVMLWWLQKRRFSARLFQSNAFSNQPTSDRRE